MADYRLGVRSIPACLPLGSDCWLLFLDALLCAAEAIRCVDLHCTRSFNPITRQITSINYPLYIERLTELFFLFSVWILSLFYSISSFIFSPPSAFLLPLFLSWAFLYFGVSRKIFFCPPPFPPTTTTLCHSQNEKEEEESPIMSCCSEPRLIHGPRCVCVLCP